MAPDFLFLNPASARICAKYQHRHYLMKQKTFTGRTVDQAMKAKERWLSNHKAVVKNESTAIVSKPAGRFTPIIAGTVTDVSICIEYEEGNEGQSA
jgi:hypothetical protein